MKFGEIRKMVESAPTEYDDCDVRIVSCGIVEHAFGLQWLVESNGKAKPILCICDKQYSTINELQFT